ncbi:YncE family protein [Candidatus Nitrosotenuis sp. DW1]|uniref:YncE family protein n=1 Tax=Candidatus Nitrosotenuis sp. DW1 TaxID=2259672 RepID=UPI0015CD3902|nr:YncE family protein [Candidatus Nitrosotenuis sp. DW1]QLH09259.1 hypothetical protein DSQ19_07065 [Candidatus Nitrosotenuis sp. DW1]
MKVKVIATVLAILMLGISLIPINNAFAHHFSKEIPVSTSPLKMSITDNYLFVSNLGQREISIIDTITDQVVGTITTSEGVVAVKAIPEKNLVYAATFESGGIDVYTLDAKQYVKTIELPDSKLTVWHSPGDDNQVYLTLLTGGVALDYNPKNGILYVANYNANYVATIDTDTNQVLEKIPVSPHPYALKVDSITGKILVANMAGNEITFLVPDEKGGKVTHTVSSTVKTGTVPWGIDIDTMKHLAYVTHRGGHHITVIDVIGEKILDTIPVGDDTQAIAVDTTEHQIYASYLQQNKIVKIDGKTNQIVNTIEIGDLTWDLAIDSTTHKIYASIQGQDKVFVLGPKSIAMTLPVVTMQTPVALVGNIQIHGQDVDVSDATVDIDRKHIVLNTHTPDGGKITLGIPRMILDSKQGGTIDMPFMIYANNKLITGDPAVGDEDTRFVTIEVPKDTESVTISGTSVIPEFGPMSGLILVASMASIMVLAKTRFRFGQSVRV